MRAYVAIQPPEPIANRIAEFSRALATPHIRPEDSSGPHITLRAPQTIDDNNAWLKNVMAALENTPPFKIHFGTPISFGGRVLALSVRGQGLAELNNGLRLLLHTFDDDTIHYHDGDAFSPHLTLAYCSGLTPEQVDEQLARIKHELPLRSFEANQITVFGKHPGASQYEVLTRLPLRS